MATKFIRGLVFNTGGAGGFQRASYLLKFMYEFWGYCIYGGASTSTPGTGAFATTTPFGGGLPTNFTEGTSVLTSGSDGYTNATTIFRMDGYTDFFSTSSNFNASMVGKQLVMWKPNSGSSEDSVYNIIGFKNSNNIVINVNNGGTPSGQADGYRPTVTTRSSINYRVVDINAAGVATGVAHGNYIVFQLDPTGINTGQANSQIQFLLASTNTTFNAKMSPNGSWTGSAFGGDASGTIVPNTLTFATFFNGTTSGGQQTINLIGDKSFLICNIRDNVVTTTSGATFHFEIPERLYTAAQDPNPLIMSLNGLNNTGGQQFHSTGTTHSYGGGFTMRCNDGVYRNYRMLAKASTGDGNASGNFNSLASVANIFGNALSDYKVALTPVYGSVMTSQGILCLPAVAGQFSLARVRLRTIRFSNSLLPLFTRFESNGNFIQMSQGVAITWDKTVLPITLFPV